MTDLAAKKAEARALALSRRAELPSAEREAASARALARLRPFLRPGETVALFWPIRDEIDPRPLIADIRALGGMVVLPAIVNRRLLFREFQDERDLEGGTFGTRHPSSHCPERDPDFIVAPLAAFDRAGGRVGYGRGYYDGAIARLHESGRRPRLLGLAFAVQEVAEVPMEPHDQRLSGIATEGELILVGPPA